MMCHKIMVKYISLKPYMPGNLLQLLSCIIYVAFHQHFGSDVTSASFVFNWSCGSGATITHAARIYTAVQTWNKVILYVTTKVVVKGCILHEWAWLAYTKQLHCNVYPQSSYLLHSQPCITHFQTEWGWCAYIMQYDALKWQLYLKESPSSTNYQCLAICFAWTMELQINLEECCAQ